MKDVTLDEALDIVERLTTEQQETLVDVVRRRLIDARREQIARRGKQAMKAAREGKGKKGSVEDFIRDMES